ncbi:Rho GTPase-activating protein syde2 [Globodera pallida]|nr:Rho GTPase-activating protein syde2 [Globodera pallida]
MFFRFLNWLAAGEPWQLVMSVVLHLLGIFTGLWIWYIFPKQPVRMRARKALVELEKGQLLLGGDEMSGQEEEVSSADEEVVVGQRREGKAAEPFTRNEQLADQLLHSVAKSNRFNVHAQVRGGGDGSSAELEAVRVELAGLYKTKALNDQQLINANNRLGEQDLERVTGEIRQIKEDRQCLLDEHIALQTAYHSMEEKYVRTDQERAELIIRLKELKEKEISLVNDMNEREMQLQHQKIQSQLAEASRPNLLLDAKAYEMITLDGFADLAATSSDECNEMGEVNDVLFHPNGKFFFTAGMDKKVKMWAMDHDSFCKKADFTGANQAITRLDLDSEFRHILASSNDFAIRIWTIEDQRLRFTFTGHSDKVTTARFLNSGRSVVSGSNDRTIKVWDIASNRCQKTLFPASTVCDLVSNERGIGCPLISCHFDKSIRFWDVRSGDQPANILKLGARVTSLNVTLDCRSLLCSARDETLTLIDLRNFGTLHIYSAEQYRTSSDFGRAVISPSDTFVASGSADGQIFVWNLLTTRLEKVLHKSGHEGVAVLSLSWHPGGHSLLSGDKRRGINFNKSPRGICRAGIFLLRLSPLAPNRSSLTFPSGMPPHTPLRCRWCHTGCAGGRGCLVSGILSASLPACVWPPISPPLTVCRRAKQQMKRPPQHCEHVAGPSSSSAFGGGGVGQYAGELPEDVYRQLREVDQQSSTLTTRGVQGFSARVLNREEYKTPRYGSAVGGEIRVVQLVEIIKKPGQSLGLYLREGNGVDQFTGVFVSRFGENSELQRCGDILRPGDQVLAVNNVLVREMAIDDVVLMLSIPRRLLLRTSFLKDQRDQLAVRGPSERIERPVVVFQKMPDVDNRRDSEASSSGILAKPASTAASWLGRKVRQQQQQKKQQRMQQQQVGVGAGGGREMIDAFVQSDQQQQQLRHRQYPQQLQQQQQQQQQQQILQPNNSSVGRQMDGTDAVAQSARIPPPRVQPFQQALNGIRRSSRIRPPPMPSPIPRPNGTSRSPPQRSAACRPPPPHQCSGDTSSVCTTNGPRCCFESPVPFGYRNEEPLKVPGIPQPTNPDRCCARVDEFFNGLSDRRSNWRGDAVPPAFHPPPSNAPGAPLPFYANPCAPTHPSGGAFSDIEVGRQRRNLVPMSNGSLVGGTGRTVADIFSAKEYRNWASEVRHKQLAPFKCLFEDEDDFGGGQFVGGRRSRWAEMGRLGAQTRSNSLPPKAVLMENHFVGGPAAQNNFESASVAQNAPVLANVEGMSPAEKADILDRLHVSPLTNRRVPLRTAGPGFDVDGLSGANSLSGILSVTVVEGRNLKVPDRVHSKQLYCVLEVDEQHRARTGISTPEQHFRWAERFDIDILNATNASFFIYAWHPQLRHRFCHKGDIRLMDAFLVEGFGTNRMFTLQLEPRGQLLLKVGQPSLAMTTTIIINNNKFVVHRSPFPTWPTAFAVCSDPPTVASLANPWAVPLVLSRLVADLERRGVDTPGLYFLCGATERKVRLRVQLEENSAEADIGERPVPDPNLLTCLVKDFLRELPEPLVPSNIYTMLLDAAAGNQKLVMRIVDCLPTPNKNSLVFLMGHFRALLASEPHNGLTTQRLTGVFGPLLFCTFSPLDQHQHQPQHHQQQPSIRPSSSSPTSHSAAALASSTTTTKTSVDHRVDTLNAQQAAQALRLLLDHWPRVSKCYAPRWLPSPQSAAICPPRSPQNGAALRTAASTRTAAAAAPAALAKTEGTATAATARGKEEAAMEGITPEAAAAAAVLEAETPGAPPNDGNKSQRQANGGARESIP